MDKLTQVVIAGRSSASLVNRGHHKAARCYAQGGILNDLELGDIGGGCIGEPDRGGDSSRRFLELVDVQEPDGCCMYVKNDPISALKVTRMVSFC